MERHLWIAVLQQAFDDALGRGAPASPAEVQRHAQREALEWLDSEDFLLVCDLAGVDPAETRKRFPKVVLDSDEDPADRYEGLDPAVIDQVQHTQLDRIAYLDALRQSPSPLTRATHALDNDMKIMEALRHG